MIAAGRMDRVVIILRRVAAPTRAGEARGGFEQAGRTWGRYEPGNSIRVAFGDFRASVSFGLLTLRADPQTEAIVFGTRLLLDGREFSVRDPRPADRRDGTVVLEVIGLQGADLYASYVDNEGEMVTVRRTVPDGDPLDFPARARVTGYDAKVLVPGMVQGDRRVLLLAADVEAAGFPLPLRSSDRIVVRGTSLAIRTIDDSTHRFAGTLYAYEIVAAGSLLPASA